MSLRNRPLRVDQVRQVGWRQDRPSFHEDEMQADPEGRQAARPSHGVGAAGRRHHQAGGGQDAVAMSDLDRFIDLRRGAEVIRGDDQLAGQDTIMSSRVRRNWKNSTPSRKRRTNMSREVSISPTISAIFEGRK